MLNFEPVKLFAKLFISRNFSQPVILKAIFHVFNKNKENV